MKRGESRARPAEEHGNGCRCRDCMFRRQTGGKRIFIGDYRPRNTFEAIALLGHDEDFRASGEGEPCDYPPGSAEKVEAMAQRVLLGQDLHSDGDARDCERRPMGKQWGKL